MLLDAGKRQTTKARKMAERACQTARAVLSNTDSSSQDLGQSITMIDRALVNVSAVPSNRIYRKKLHTYRAIGASPAHASELCTQDHSS